MSLQITKKRITTGIIAAIVLAVSLPIAVSAQSQPPQKPPTPPPPPAKGESSSKNPQDGSAVISPPPASNDPANPQGLPAFDPLAAMKNIEVGQYYLQKGNIDAAIDRFHDAIQFQPTYAEPWRLLGEAYEKKSDWGESIKSYQKYLKVYPHSPMRKKIEDHIADLQKIQQREAQKRKGN